MTAGWQFSKPSRGANHHIGLLLRQFLRPLRNAPTGKTHSAGKLCRRAEPLDCFGFLHDRMFSMLNSTVSSTVNNCRFNLLNMTLAERLEYALRAAGMSRADLARCVDLSRGAITHWLDGSTKELSSSNLVKAARCLNVDPNWLAEGTGRGPGDNPKVREMPLKYQDGRVPLISWSDAAYWLEVREELLDSSRTVETFPCPEQHSELTFALRVSGESMSNAHNRPSFGDGDLIFVDPLRSPEHRSYVVVRMPGSDEAILRQLVIEGARQFLKALNPAWPEPIVELTADVALCGVVIYKGERIV